MKYTIHWSCALVFAAAAQAAAQDEACGAAAEPSPPGQLDTIPVATQPG